MLRNGQPLTELTGLKSEIIHRLNMLWLQTVEEVAGIIRLPEIYGEVSQNMMIALFANELGITAEQADKEIIQVIRQSIPDSEWYALAGAEEPLSFGSLFDDEDQIAISQAPGSPATPSQKLPSRINLLEQFPHRFPDMRDQGQRGTCVAFAVTVLHEYIRSQNRHAPHLSEEFLYWAARNKQYQHAASTCHQCGTHPKYALEALLEMGQCLHETKSYRRDLPCNLKFAEGDTEDNSFACPDNTSNSDPSYLATGELAPDLQTSAAVFRLTGWKSVRLSSIPAIQLALYKDRPVVITVDCYLSSWYNPRLYHSGVITLPFQQEINDFHYLRGGHALLAVGYENDSLGTPTHTPGGGYFILRNSWGKDWGDASPAGFRAGYGMLPYAYLQGQRWHALTLEPI